MTQQTTQQRKTTQGPTAQSGFTLIELSIVLVIIGLIVGGVLVGQDLIRAAEVRAGISQVEKFDAAINTFRTKFNGYPGDLTSPATFGLTALGSGSPDGDGLIEGQGADSDNPCGENALAWNHLSTAGLVEGVYGTGVTYGTAAACLGSATDSAVILPTGRLGGRVTIYVADNQNQYQLSSISGNIGTDGVPATVGDVMTRLQAYQIDQKMDDAAPDTGRVLARGGTSLNSAATTCVSGGAYAITSEGARQAKDCQLRIRTSG